MNQMQMKKIILSMMLALALATGVTTAQTAEGVAEQAIAEQPQGTTEQPSEPIAAEPVLSSSVEQLWDEGNRYYIDARYDSALKCYEQIVANGYTSPKLWYNAANAAFKQGALGRAILYYNRALEGSHASEDVLHNLAIAEQQTKDRIAVVPEFFLLRWMRAVRGAMSCTAWSVLSLVLFGVILTFLLLFLLSQRLALRKTGFYGTLTAGVMFLAVTAMALSARSSMLTRDGAIVMSSAISVKSSPDRSATDIFVLHEGTKVRVTGEIDGWSEIVIADGKKGWTESRNIEKI